MNAINTGLLNPEIKIFIINNHNGTNIPEESNFILINDNELNNKSKPFTKKEIGFQSN